RFQVVEIEHALGAPPEETRHAVFGHLAARGQQSGARQQALAERDQIVLVAAGAVQQQKHRQTGPRRRDETMAEAEVGHDGNAKGAREVPRALVAQLRSAVSPAAAARCEYRASATSSRPGRASWPRRR